MTNADYDRTTERDLGADRDLRADDEVRAQGDLRDQYETRADVDLRAEDDLRAQDDLRVESDVRREAGAGEVRMDDRPGGGMQADAGSRPALVDDSGELLERWQHVQAAFVDSPRDAVGEASAIVRDVLDRLSRSFDAERRRLDDAWESGGEPSTEDLRVALQRYRSFFERLLAA